jgi:hypothetical protein
MRSKKLSSDSKAQLFQMSKYLVKVGQSENTKAGPFEEESAFIVSTPPRVAFPAEKLIKSHKIMAAFNKTLNLEKRVKYH